jgi:DNA-binding PadR family transcriptional regulator
MALINKEVRMAKINKTSYGILSLLSKKDMSGYDIKQMAKKVAPFHWSESNAQIYPILQTLEKQQLVSSCTERSNGNRKRKIFSITPKGLEHLKAWLIEPAEPTQYREELILKLTCGEHIPIPLVIKHLEAYKNLILDQQKSIEKIQEDINSKYKEDILRKMYLKMTYDHIKMVLEAKLLWCDKNLNSLADQSLRACVLG